LDSPQVTPLPLPRPPLFFHSRSDASVDALRALFRRHPRERGVAKEKPVVLSTAIQNDVRRVLGAAAPQDDTVLLLVPRWRREVAPPPPRARGRIFAIAALVVVAACALAGRNSDVRHHVQHAWKVGAAI
jgi:hypothetical protein